MTDEFENALAWFAAAPARFAAAAKHDLSVTAEWIWEVLQGDFNDDATGSQIAVGTVISMIPFVDQICDVRDIIANCKKINKDPTSAMLWLGLILTLIGLFPTLGSFVKGCGKVMFSSIRRYAHKKGAARVYLSAIETSIGALNNFLARPKVANTLKMLNINNPYKYLSLQVKSLSSKLSAVALLKCFDDGLKAANSLFELVKKYGGSALASKVDELVAVITHVRNLADKKLASYLSETTDVLNLLSRRLDMESDALHRAHLNSVNPHAFTRFTDATEEAAYKKAKPNWVDQTTILTYPPAVNAPIPPTTKWTDMAKTTARRRINDAHKTFQEGTITAIIIQPGEKLYRVIDPGSADNSICWMSEIEFKKITGKDDWRKRFAVWAHWNTNGEYITYVVPAGNPLHVWEGVAASQKMKNADYVLLGGARQIVVDPEHLQKLSISKRMKTNWGYDDLDTKTNLVGVPTLRNNYE